MRKRVLGGLAAVVGSALAASAQVPGPLSPGLTPSVSLIRDVVPSPMPLPPAPPAAAKPLVLSAVSPAGGVNAATPRPDRNTQLGRPIILTSAADVCAGPSGHARQPADALPRRTRLHGRPRLRHRHHRHLQRRLRPCGPPGRTWANFEWLYWVTSGQSLPALVTAAPAGTPLASAGALGQSTTSTLFGNQRTNNDWRSGFRYTGGLWLDPDQTRGLEVDFLFLGRSTQRYATASDGSAVITRPFFNTLLGRQDTELVSFPGVVAGAVTVDPKTTVIGGGLNYLHNLCCDPCGGRVDLLLGYRYLNVGDSVSVTENLTALPGSAVPAGTTFNIRDRFQTSNNFNGGLIGLAGERRFDRFFVGGRATVALGQNQQFTQITGFTTITPPGGPAATFPGGLLAQPSNIGRYTHNAFAVLPELGLKAGWQVTDHARIYVGYNFIYLSNAIRAGDQINLAVNTTQLPPAAAPAGAAAPVFDRKATDFWMQGVSVGAELRF